ncbi:MAG: hypothetical protein R3C11_20070 [Planctomycetaceae bacterium]
MPNNPLTSQIAEATCGNCQQYNAVWTRLTCRGARPKIRYTDGRREGEPVYAFRDQLPVIRCSNCGQACRVSSSPVHTGFNSWTPHLVRQLDTDDCFTGLSSGLLTTTERRDTLLTLLRLSNDPTRYHDQPATHHDRSPEWMNAMEECLSLLALDQDLYAIRLAETQREMGRFHESLQTLSAIKYDEFNYKWLGMEKIQELSETENSSLQICYLGAIARCSTELTRKPKCQ